MYVPNTAQWLLRRLAARCIRVHQRQQGKSAALAVFGTTLPVYCSTYIEYYDALRQLAKVYTSERFEGGQAIVALIKVLRIWAPLLARDIRGVKEGEFCRNASVPDDVIRDTKELIKYATEHRDAAGEPLSVYRAVGGKRGLNPIAEKRCYVNRASRVLALEPNSVANVPYPQQLDGARSNCLQDHRESRPELVLGRLTSDPRRTHDCGRRPRASCERPQFAEPRGVCRSRGASRCAAEVWPHGHPRPASSSVELAHARAGR